MAAPKAQSKDQLLERRKRVSELYLQCETMAEIGRRVGVSANTVYKDICWAREQWRAKATESIEIHTQRELGRIDHVELEAWRGWERSIGKMITTTRETGTGTVGGGELGQIDKTKETVDYKAGDPRFLDIVNKCIDSRRKILGLDAPVQTKVEMGGAVQVIDRLTAARQRLAAAKSDGN